MENPKNHKEDQRKRKRQTGFFIGKLYVHGKY